MHFNVVFFSIGEAPLEIEGNNARRKHAAGHSRYKMRTNGDALTSRHEGHSIFVGYLR